MAQFINYLAGMPQIDLGQSLAQGLAMGESIQAAQQRRELVRQKVEEARRKREQEAQFADKFNLWLENPTAKGYAELVAIDPSRLDALKAGYSQMDEERRTGEIRENSFVKNLADNGDWEGLIGHFRKKVADNPDDAGDKEVLAYLESRDPRALKRVGGLATAQLIALAGADKVAEAYPAFAQETRDAELQPDLVRKGKAEADAAAVEAKYAEPKVLADIASQRATAAAAIKNAETAAQRLALDRGKAAAEGAKGKAPTESQIKDAFNAKRMARATSIIAEIEPATYGERVKLAANPFSAQRKKYDSAKTEWADAMLRLTSGAEAPEAEVRRTAETYFPSGTDSEDVIRQKAEMRRQIMRDAIMRSGDAAAGLVMDGYRFKGGDPAQKSSWEKVS